MDSGCMVKRYQAVTRNAEEQYGELEIVRVEIVGERILIQLDSREWMYASIRDT